MNYRDFKRSSMAAFPSQYTDEADLLKHALLGIGTGLAWKNGELRDYLTNIEDPEKNIRKHKAGMLAFYKRQLESEVKTTPKLSPEMRKEYKKAGLKPREPGEFWKECIADLKKPVKQMQKKELASRLKTVKERQPSPTDCWVLNDDGTVGSYIEAPQFVKCPLQEIPDDIKPDWLAAVRRFFDLLRTRRFRFKDPRKDAQTIFAIELELNKRFPRRK